MYELLLMACVPVGLILWIFAGTAWEQHKGKLI